MRYIISIIYIYLYQNNMYVHILTLCNKKSLANFHMKQFLFGASRPFFFVNSLLKDNLCMLFYTMYQQ